ncbi:MAG: hypothetical protein RLP09_24955 [Sandaracinaceae bacterium]
MDSFRASAATCLALLLVGCASRVAYVRRPAAEADVVLHVPCQGPDCAGAPPAAEPPPPPQIPPPRMLAAGMNHTCALVEDGGVYCWGANDRGQLGEVAADRAWIPGRVPGLPRMNGVWAGGDQTCARAEEDGRLWCWGDTGLPDEREGPFATQLAYADVRQVSLGYRIGCMVDDGGHTFCWGNYAQPQGPRWRTPQRVAIDAPVAILSGMQRQCALTQSGEVHCWGRPMIRYGHERVGGPFYRVSGVEGATLAAIPKGNQDQLIVVDRRGRLFESQPGRRSRRSYGHTPPMALAPIEGVDDPAQLLAGAGFFCVRTGQGTVACWGSNQAGQLGDGSLAARSRPTFLALAGVQEIALGENHACARDAAQVWCWGSNSRGQVGLERTTRVPDPTPVPW